MVVVLAGCGYFYRQNVGSGTVDPFALKINVPDTATKQARFEEQPGTPMVRESEPAKETIFPNAADEIAETTVVDEEGLVRTDTVDEGAEDDETGKGMHLSLIHI